MMTLEEHEAQRISPIPIPLREAWQAIRGEITWLHIDWDDCKKLFGTDQRTVDLLNATAPSYFASVQRMMWGMIIGCESLGTSCARRLEAFTCDEVS